MISVIVPIFNADKYLSRCISSIINQSYSDFELLLVNDGSIDESGAICDHFAKLDNRIRVFHNLNRGAAASRTFGVEKSLGDYICFVDADDFLPCDSLSILFSSLNKYKVDISIGSYTRIFDSSQDYCGLPLKRISGSDYLYLLVTGNWKLYGPVAKLYKKQLFSDSIKRIPKSIYVGEDLLLNICVSLNTLNVIMLPDSVYNYCQVNTSVTHRFSYTESYLITYISTLKSILTSVDSRDEYIALLSFHCKANMLYNVILDDIDDSCNYNSSLYSSLRKESLNFSLTLKEKLVLAMIKYKLFRFIYRKTMSSYRNASGIIYLIVKFLNSLK